MGRALSSLALVALVAPAGFAQAEHYDCDDGLARAFVEAPAEDASHRQVTDTPWRISRELALLAEQAETPEQRVFWLELAANESIDSLVRAYRKVGSERDLQREASCLRALAQDPASFPSGPLEYGDSYVTRARVLGVYPLIAQFLKPAVRRENEKLAALWQAGADTQPTRLVPAPSKHADRDAFADLVAESTENPLRYPVLDAAERSTLLHAYAPSFALYGTAPANAIGIPAADGSFEVQPVVFGRVSRALIDDQWLIQLNYQIWFGERPADGFDPYAGTFDGLIWRVTIGERGELIAFDSVHNCACYHRIYADRAPAIEPMLVHELSGIDPREAYWVHVSADDHFITTVSSEPPTESNSVIYALTPMEHLDQSALFNEHGILKASARLERLYLWPSGVRNPGAMRQWGTHALAFVGKAFFDDPTLLAELGTVPDAEKDPSSP